MTDDPIRIDHVTIAGRSLSHLAEPFAAVGLEPVYGGRHEGLPTHMSMLGFEDGTYIELISRYDDDSSAPYWAAAMRADAGPCAWAIRATAIYETADRLRAAGIPVDGPSRFRRDRPNGEPAEWLLATLGNGDPGELLPFLIEDLTPRERRIVATPVAAESELVGVSRVVLAVPDLDGAATLVRTAFDLAHPVTKTVPVGPFAGRVARFADFPAVLLSPAEGGPVAARLDRHGTGPCAFLLESTDLAASEDRFGGLEPAPLGHFEARVVDPDRFGDIGYLGVVGR